LETPSEGKLFFDEQKITQLPPDKRDLGMVFQNYALFPHLTVFKNILLGLEKSNLSKFDKEEQVQKVAHSLGLADLLIRKPSEISGGQRQRVALARLLARNPSIHLLDEPLSNLDANLRLQMRQELAELHRKHQKTTLFVTHDQVEAMTLGQRICLFNQGSVEQMGTPQELYDSPKNLFVAGFFGMPSINLIHGNIDLKSNEEQSIFNSKDANLSLPLPPNIQPAQQKIILGIRPESFQLVEHSPKNSFVTQRTEYLGDSLVCYLTADELGITCKQPSFEINPADKVGIEVNWNHVHWFDPESGERIQLSES
jgi:ABC-type sugar transport system ATPase subunit